VRLETSRGVLTAERVIVTVPLGVLKEETITFDPPLSEAKRAVIAQLGFGVLDKVVLAFDEPFWPQKADVLGLVGAGQPVPVLLNGLSFGAGAVLIGLRGGDGWSPDGRRDRARMTRPPWPNRRVTGCCSPGRRPNRSTSPPCMGRI
jgi:monoamine oxidase